MSTEDRSVITPDELKQLKGERLFFKRHYRGFTKQIGAKIVLYQNLLAMQKHSLKSHALPVDTAPAVGLLRGAITSLRKA